MNEETQLSPGQTEYHPQMSSWPAGTIPVLKMGILSKNKELDPKYKEWNSKPIPVQ